MLKAVVVGLGGSGYLLGDGPVVRKARWLTDVNRAEMAAELESLRKSVQRGAPFGTATWLRRTARRLGLESALRPRGRPRKEWNQ